MTPRAAQIARFLAHAGWDTARRAPLAGDASLRRYERLLDGPGGASAVLMDAPPDKGEDVRPFLRIASFLLAHGFSAPRILASDESGGLLLLEDLGDALFARVLTAGTADETTLYAAAVDVLASLHRLAPPPGLAAYSPAMMAEKAALAGRWYAGGSAAEPATAAGHPAEQALAQAIGPLLERFATEASVLVQRDYHAENLIWLPERHGVARVGLLDFQDALAGHPAYDLVSLLEDARRDVPPPLQAQMVARYLDATGLEPDGFRRAYALLGAQRNLRILGVFARLSLHFGKPDYVGLIPRVWSHLQQDLSHPDLEALSETVRTCLPAPDPQLLARLTARCATVPTL